MLCEKRGRSPIAIAAIVLLAALLLAQPCCAQTKTPSVAPLNPAFVQYQKDLASGRIQTLTEEGYGLGFVPSPVDTSYKKTAGKTAGRQLLSFPEAYDLRTLGKLTFIKNQYGCGSCWAFAAFGGLESCLLTGEGPNYSENNIKNRHGFDPSCCNGGQYVMTMAYLTRWDGPMNEVDDWYNTTNCASPTGLAVRKHIQEVLTLPDRSGFMDNDTIKQAVMTYGAVCTSMYWGDAYYDGANYSYYYTGSAPHNHAVCIVGWDDNFDRNKFRTPAPGNGAFIIRNSWGTGWGQYGYFYMSYYGSMVGVNNTVFCGNEPVDNYNRIYYYDTLGWCGIAGYGTDTAWCANVFTTSVEDNGVISAVGFYALWPGDAGSLTLPSAAGVSAIQYDLYVYLDPDSGPINTSGYAARKTGVLTDTGYHTVKLDSPVAFTPGQRFSIVVKLTTPGLEYPIAIEGPVSGYSSRATAQAGESFISSDGASWTDLTSSYPNWNACLKAYGTSSLIDLTVGDLRSRPNGGAARLRGAVVTWSASSNFYVESDDRSCGIAVYKSGHGLTAGMRADIIGTLSTNTGGEKYINATSVVQNGTGSVEPILLANRAVGGADWKYDPATGTGQKGIKEKRTVVENGVPVTRLVDAADLNNIGLLVTTTGKVTAKGTNWFYIDDGSALKDNSIYKGIKVQTGTSMTVPALNAFVKVTGISSCFKSGSDLYRLIRATGIIVCE